MVACSNAGILSSGNFIIECPYDFVGDEISISIVNALGQGIFTECWSTGLLSGKKEFDLHGVTGGVYFIEIKTQNIFLKKKIIFTK